MKSLPATGTARLLTLLDSYVPDEFINTHWNARPACGPRWQFSAAQLWRTHLLALLTPVHSFNLLARMLPEQSAWRRFARLRHRHQVPDVRILNAFRSRLNVMGFRQINETLLQPLIETATLWEKATALIDATDLPASCHGFKKKTPVFTRPNTRPWAGAPLRPARAAGSSVTRSIPYAYGGDHMRLRSCWCRWSVGSPRPM
jgi:hypothetical protein